MSSYYLLSMASSLYGHFNTEKGRDYYLENKRPICYKGLWGCFPFLLMLTCFVMIQIWEHVLHENPKIELTKKQIYASWAYLNENTWHLNDKQVKSAQKILKNQDGNTIEIIPICAKDGISAIAFSFKKIVDNYGKEITKIAMDSIYSFSLLTCHISWIDLGGYRKNKYTFYKLYVVVGEVNRQAISLAFAFTAATDRTVEKGAKNHML